MRLSIKNKIIILVLSLIIIPASILGTQAYNKSTKILKNQFEMYMTDVNTNANDAIKLYINSHVRTIEVISNNKYLKGILENSEYENECREIFEGYADSYEEILSVYIGTEDGNHTYDNNAEDYDPRTRPWYKEAIKEKKAIMTPAYLDEATNELVVSFTAPVFNNDNEIIGVVASDVTLEKIADKVNSMKIGKSGDASIVDSKGNFIANKDKSKIGGSIGVPKILDKINKQAEDIVSYDIKDEDGSVHKKMASLKRLENTDWTMVSVIDFTEIEEKSNNLLHAIFGFGIINIILASIIGIIFSNRITKNIDKILYSINKVKEGDFTVSADVKSKDEIGKIADDFNIMVHNIKNLLLRNQEVSKRLSESSNELAAITEEVSASSQEISESINEISKGAAEQSADAENGVKLALDLDNKFSELLGDINKMLKGTDEVISFNKVGIESIEDLQKKTDLNNESILKIENALGRLTHKSENIGVILETIRSISTQTNLLALNASIEAARAGEAGKGFAVVAEEIRKLAEGSGMATNEIQSIIDSIYEESRNTVVIMDEVKNISIDQTNSVQYVNKSFEDISNSIEHITSEINIVSNNLSNLSKNKDLIVESIKSISLVSEESAASSEEINASVEQQSIAVEHVANSAQELNEISLDLNDSINKFNI
ncbi:methyl-accepting chemotaxis protein [Tepidibacter aestuarii]|uniref:methyl-accepting chemotaxis protein n=1 Tax=Tepidibacter aestuarii TaxID=2925782 RepID=UPI0020BEC292|nr:methyl-accepting chemotaxis protein [Tepidibacter aestuarii]CAH2213374.1 methyl-accepting chemotaxis protein [Tepidibacter aestuarii]